MTRNQIITQTSIVGIVGNVLLSAFKMVIGVITNSVSIVADAVNHLSDSMVSFITIIGVKIAEKEPDKKHPFGYGRIEYLTNLIIGGLITYAGITTLLQSIRRILHPEENYYTFWTNAIIVVALVVKVALGHYTVRQGKACHSEALLVLGRESLVDSIASAAVLVAAVLYRHTDVDIEAYVGLVISLLVLKEGLETLWKTVNRLLGEPVSVEVAAKVKKTILSFSEVDGVFDLIIHSYGEERRIGSAHVAVPEVLTAAWVDNLQRHITRKVLEDTGVDMQGITIYAVNSRDKEAAEIQKRIKEIAEENPATRGVHGFYLDRVDRVLSFEVEVDFSCRNRSALREALVERLRMEYPDYDIEVKINYDMEG